jgi:hypothetical protein
MMDDPSVVHGDPAVSVVTGGHAGDRLGARSTRGSLALIAPPGECEYCDRRRAYAAAAMRRGREKKK